MIEPKRHGERMHDMDDEQWRQFIEGLSLLLPNCFSLMVIK